MRPDSEGLRRRQFLERLGCAALSIRILTLTDGASAVEAAPPDCLAVTSSLDSKLGHWAGHTHLLYVPLQSFRAPPPEGVTLSTTRTYFHSHEVVLTQAQLVDIARGSAVRVSDTAGAHTYSIELSERVAV